MKNRNGDEYNFIRIDENTWTIEGDLSYWRFGCREGQDSVDWTNLGFVDPSGGPFISVGMKLDGRPIRTIRVDGEKILFEV